MENRKLSHSNEGDTNGYVESGETSGSAREDDGDFTNKKAGAIKQVIRKIKMVLFMLGHIFCELNGLHQREFTCWGHYEVILRINDIIKI